MTPEDKELLLVDLCARLPYSVKVDIIYNKEHGSSDRLRICSEGCLTLNTDVLGLYIEDEIYLKLYLRPMSSMTKGETKELFKEIGFEFTCNTCGIPAHYNYEFAKHIQGIPTITNVEFIKVIDWLNKNMFDYRGLIEKGLALEAPEGMYN